MNYFRIPIRSRSVRISSSPNASFLSLIGRKNELFESDINRHEDLLCSLVSSGRFLVIGGAGSIGQSVTREIFKRNPKLIHVVDISENNMVELVRDIRSTIGYGSGDFRTFTIDCGEVEQEALMASEGPYDYVFNLSALKHVRSEKDPFKDRDTMDDKYGHESLKDTDRSYGKRKFKGKSPLATSKAYTAVAREGILDQLKSRFPKSNNSLLSEENILED